MVAASSAIGALPLEYVTRLWTATSHSAGWFLVCATLHLGARILLRRTIPAALLDRVRAEDRIYVPEMALSTLHGLKWCRTTFTNVCNAD